MVLNVNMSTNDLFQEQGLLMCWFVWRRKLALTMVLLSMTRWLPWRLVVVMIHCGCHGCSDSEHMQIWFAHGTCSSMVQVRGRRWWWLLRFAGEKDEGELPWLLVRELRSAPIWLRHGGLKMQGCSGFVVALGSRWSAISVNGVGMEIAVAMTGSDLLQARW